METILISACLLGDNTKYDGTNNYKENLKGLLEFYRLIPFCPEVEGGLKTPREPSEVKGNFVYTKSLKDVTKNFTLGAEKALALCKRFNIKLAILKERSPSCGTHKIHNGFFDNNLIDGMGVTAKRLKANGVECINEDEAEELLAKLIKEKEQKEARIAENKRRKEEKHSGDSKEEKPFKKPYKKYGEKKSFEGKKEYSGKRSYGDKKPYGEKKSFSKKPYRKFDKTEGSEEKPFKKRSYAKKSFGDKKPYGEKRSYGNKSFHANKGGYKKSFGDKKPFGKRPYKGKSKTYLKKGS